MGSRRTVDDTHSIRLHAKEFGTDSMDFGAVFLEIAKGQMALNLKAMHWVVKAPLRRVTNQVPTMSW